MDRDTERPSPGVISALALGWRLAELYDHDLTRVKGLDVGSLPPHLPGMSEMGPRQQAEIVFDQARTASGGLPTGISSFLEPVADALKAADRAVDDVRQRILEAHQSIQVTLAGENARLSVAYSLGRALADTCRFPLEDSSAADAASTLLDALRTEFGEYRVVQLQAWLDDLDSDLPAGAAATISISLDMWRQKIASEPSGSDWLHEPTVRRLHRQSEIWRRLLVGDKDPSSLLRPDDYVAAAKRMLGHLGRLTADFAHRTRWYLAGGTLVAIILAVVAVVLAPGEATKAVALVVTAAGFFGAAGKTVSATLGRTVAQAEASIWRAELDQAIGQAATVLPR
jgi:hypothetical protein